MIRNQQNKFKLNIRYPNRRISSKLFKYVLGEYILIVIWCIGIFLSLFIVGLLYDELEDFLKHGSDLRLIIHYIFLLQPKFLINVIPISLLISTVYVISNLCRYNELTALRASGISVLQTGLPILCVAAAFSLLEIAITEKMAPTASQNAKQLKKELSDPYGKRRLPDESYLAFRNKRNYRDWFFEIFNADGVSNNVSVTQFRADKSVSWELTAKKAEYRDGRWHFRDLVLRRFDEEGYLLLEKPEDFDALDLPELDENPNSYSFLFRLRPLEEFSASSIYKVLSANDYSLTEQTEAILKTYFYYYLFLPFGCVLPTIIGIPLAITKERSNARFNFIIAIMILVLYYLFTQFFVVLGKNQVLPPLFATFTPVIIFMGLGVLLMKNKV